MDAPGDRPRFALGWPWWVAGGGAALLTATGSVVRARFREPAFLASTFALSALITLLLAVLVGWIVWRVAGRRRRAGQVAFGLWLLLTLAGQAVGVAKHAVVANTVRDLGEAQARLVEALIERASSPLRPDQIPAEVASLDALFDPVAQRAILDGKAVVEAVRAHHRAEATLILEFAIVAHGFHDFDPTDFRGAAEAAERTRRLGLFRAALGANERYRRFLAEEMEALRDRIAAIPGYDRFADDILEVASRPAIVFGPLDIQATAFTQFVVLYEFLDRRAGAWTIAPDGTVAWADAHHAARFDEGLETLHRLRDAVQRSQTQEATADPDGSTPPAAAPTEPPPSRGTPAATALQGPRRAAPGSR